MNLLPYAVLLQYISSIRKTQRHTDTQTHRQTHRHTDTQTHRHTDTQTHRHTDRTDTQTEQTHTETHTDFKKIQNRFIYFVLRFVSPVSIVILLPEKVAVGALTVQFCTF